MSVIQPLKLHILIIACMICYCTIGFTQKGFIYNSKVEVVKRDSSLSELERLKRKAQWQNDKIILNRKLEQIEEAYNHIIRTDTSHYYTFPINEADIKTNHIKLSYQSLAVIDTMIIRELYDLIKTMHDFNKFEENGKVSVQFRVMGFASPDGSAKFNLRLSQQRAESIANLFKQHETENLGIDIHCKAYGRGENLLYEMKNLDTVYKRSALIVLESIDLTYPVSSATDVTSELLED